MQQSFHKAPRPVLASLPIIWFALAALFLALDFTLGPDIHFPVAYVFPVALAAWYRGLRWGFGFALGLPLLHLAFQFYWQPAYDLVDSLVNLLIRLVVFGGFAFLTAQTSRQRRRIRALEHLLPICAWCRKIRNEHDAWMPLDLYLSKNADLDFSHGICPECMHKQLASAAPAS